jgi:MoaA/NifB/PqqE/SkfB family radical SAM enzyme
MQQEHAALSINIPVLEIWTIIDMTLCNFNCPYCASGQPGQGGERSRDKAWKDETSSTKFQKIIRWVSRIPVPVGLRLQSVGEPFMCEEFLKGAAWLSNQRNIHYLELVTNGSLVKNRWARLAQDANLDRISLWMTYHHTQTTADRIVEAALFAQSQGVPVVLNTLVFPDNYDKVEYARKLCDDNKINISTDIGYDLECRTGAKGFIPAFYDDEARTRTLYGHDLILHENISTHWGERCSAGRNYIYVSSEGEIYRCFQYFMKDKRSTLGNVFDASFKVYAGKELYEPCLFSRTERCFNHEDFFHLETIGCKRTISRSMTYKNDVLK